MSRIWVTTRTSTVDLVPDGTDQTAAIQAAIDSAPDGLPWVPTYVHLPTDGPYRVDGTLRLQGRRHVVVSTVGERPFRMYTDVPNSGTPRPHLQIDNSVDCWFERVDITGPNIERVTEYPEYALYRHNPERDGKVYVFDHALSMVRANVGGGFRHCSFRNVYGDGIYVGDHLNGAANKGITFQHIMGAHCGRQAIALTCVEGVVLEDIDIRGGGRSGLDIEPNHAQDRAQRVTLRRVTIDSRFSPFVLSGVRAKTCNDAYPRTSDLLLEDCVGLTPTDRPIFDFIASGDHKGFLRIKNLRSPKSTCTTAIALRGKGEAAVTVQDCDIKFYRFNPNWQYAEGNVAVAVRVFDECHLGQLEIRGNTFNGHNQGYQELAVVEDGADVAAVICGDNTWDMGTQNDSEGTA